MSIMMWNAMIPMPGKRAHCLCLTRHAYTVLFIFSRLVKYHTSQAPHKKKRASQSWDHASKRTRRTVGSAAAHLAFYCVWWS